MASTAGDSGHSTMMDDGVGAEIRHVTVVEGRVVDASSSSSPPPPSLATLSRGLGPASSTSTSAVPIPFPQEMPRGASSPVLSPMAQSLARSVGMEVMGHHPFMQETERKGLFQPSQGGAGEGAGAAPNAAGRASGGNSTRTAASRKMGNVDIQPLQTMIGSDMDDAGFARSRLMVAAQIHCRRFVLQALTRRGLDAAWADTIKPLLDAVVATVRPNIRKGDSMDVRKFIKIKRVPGGTRSDCEFLSGAVITKNVAHKAMRSEIKKPRILVLRFAIEYERVEKKFSSLDALLLQERGYLLKMIDKIAALRPDIVVVERSVSRLAQEFLLERGITLMLNVKKSAVDYIARCTRATPLDTIDRLNFRPKLGSCELFCIRPFALPNGRTKKLAFFQGTVPDLGCTIILRGSDSAATLSHVKCVLQFGSYISNSLRLETAFINCEWAVVPPGTGLETTEEAADGDGVVVVLADKNGEAGWTPGGGTPQLSRRGPSSSTTPSAGGGAKANTTSDDAKPDSSSLGVAATQVPEAVVGAGVGAAAAEATVATTPGQPPPTSPMAIPLARGAGPDDGSPAALRGIGDLDGVAGGSLPSQASSVDSHATAELTGTPVSAGVKPSFVMGRRARERAAARAQVGLGGSSSLPPSPTDGWRSPLLSASLAGGVEVSTPTTATAATAAAATPTTLNMALRSRTMSMFGEHFEARRTERPAEQRGQGEAHVEEFARVFPQVVLSTSPFVRFPMPYVYSEEGSKCPMRQLLPKTLFRSPELPSTRGMPLAGDMDCLAPENHQSIDVLFACMTEDHSPNALPRVLSMCSQPKVINMKYYGINDVTLGNFIEHYCFRPGYTCPSPQCDIAMEHHTRSFTHDRGKIIVGIERLRTPIPNPNPGEPDVVFMWSWCKICQILTPVLPMDHAVGCFFLYFFL